LTSCAVAVTVARVTGPGTTSFHALTDGSLARAVAGKATGEATAAETELYRRFAPRVRLYGLKHLRDRGAADDLAQQVMLIVIERLRAGEVRDPDQVASFVLSTSRMVAVGLRRTEARRERLLEQFDWQEAEVAATDETALDMARIAPCLATLRDRERTILLLTFYAEKSAGDIAQALGMTSGAVRVGRHRALASMRTCLETRRPA
jgi:RNA polymerase sigma-70 factor (ECF subfamily)